jgi:hypothetical protein
VAGPQRPLDQPSDLGAESLSALLGGRRAALDATLGPLAFGVGYVVGGSSVMLGVSVAMLVSVLLAWWRLRAGDRPRAVLVGLLGVALGAVIALYTGEGVNYFLPRLVTNVLSALAWMVSIALRWPLLGVVVGTLLGQKGRWRHDPDLLRAYSRASWAWVGQYTVRIVVFTPLWWLGQTEALAIAGTVLTWPLVAVCVSASWWVIRRTLPADHPGLRHPRPLGSPLDHIATDEQAAAEAAEASAEPAPHPARRHRGAERS